MDGKMLKTLDKMTYEWFMAKIAKKQDYEYIDFAKIFKLIDIPNCRFWATTYGVGVDSIYNREKDETIEKIETFLKSNDINYENEYSEAHWVYRFKISKAKDNLDRIKALIE